MNTPDTSGSASLQMSTLFSDGMVIQRDQPIRVWGWSSPLQPVCVRFKDDEKRAVSDAHGYWEVSLPASLAGGPWEMHIEAGITRIIRDILVGEVWLCSGQSNMVIPISRVRDRYPDEDFTHPDPLVRRFQVPEVYDFASSRENIEGAMWESAQDSNIMQFSAIGYFYARELRRTLNVPVGIIVAALGGVPIQAFMSRKSLEPYPDELAQADECRDPAYVESVKTAENARIASWNDELRKADAGYPDWASFTHDDSAWKDFEVPGWFDGDGPEPFRGVVWFRREFHLPENLAGLPGRLELGVLVYSDETFLNGSCIGSTGYLYPPRKYDFAPGLLKAGRNTVAVRLVCPSGRGGFIEDKPYRLIVGGKEIPLHGAWKSRIGAFAEELSPQIFMQYVPTGLFNAMIHPLFRYAIQGVLWVHGETNADRNPDSDRYSVLLKLLVNEWRRSWKRDKLPFFVAQLANYGRGGYPPVSTRWADFREQQAAILDLPATGLVCVSDLGEWNDLHPTRKREVALRFSLLARRFVYGENTLTAMGPLFQGASVESSQVVVRFDHTGSGLATSDGKSPAWFEIAGSDSHYHPAETRIAGDTVVVSHPAVPDPRHLRYAWADNPEGINLCNSEGLPAFSFRTEL